MKWKLDSTGRFYDPGEDSVVYYHCESGDTHLISDFAAYLIQQLSEHPADISELVQRISVDISPDELAHFSPTLPETLEELAKLDILNQI